MYDVMGMDKVKNEDIREKKEHIYEKRDNCMILVWYMERGRPNKVRMNCVKEDV